MLEIKVTTTQR